MTSRILTTTMFSALGLMLTAATASSQTTAWAATPAAYGRSEYRAQYADAQRGAFENGYRDGLKRGEQAARDRRAVDVQRERDYRDGENGYNRSFGDRHRYRDNYRGGFTQGYREGYDRRGANTDGNYGNGTSGGYGRESTRGYGRSTSYGARQNGASDGYEKGLEDVNDRKYPDATRHKWYRNGDHDYDNRYGSKDTYRSEYRRGFDEGYDRAFRERGRR